MTSLLRSTRFGEAPLVLMRSRKQDARDEGDVVSAEQPEQDRDYAMVERPLADRLAAATDAAENDASADVGETASVVSYEEYETRFHEELDKRREQARNEGYQAGHAQGLEQGQRDGEKEFSERLGQVDALFVSARDAVEKNLDDMADTAIDIVFEALTRILGERFVEKSGTEAVVREVIRQSKERSKLVVRVAPADFEALSTRRSELVDGLNVGQVELVADDLVELGGCILETPSGSLDGRLEIQLQRLRETLLNARQKWHEHGD